MGKVFLGMNSRGIIFSVMSVLAALAAPLRFIGKIMSRIVTTIVLTLVYIFGIGPVAILGKIFRKDFIGEKRRSTHSYWLHHPLAEPTLENLKKPY